MQLSELSQVIGGRQQGRDIAFSSVSTDSRKLKPGDLFIALRGDRYDANTFVRSAKDKGAVAAVVDKEFSDDLPMVLVDDTREALGKLAADWRRRLNPVLVGITGSNGKTTTKELLAAILGLQSTILYTQGNFNNDIGVPLTLLRLTEEHSFAVVEMGANHPGEIAYVSRIAKPDIALITNAGPAHLEGFGSVGGVARAKGEIIESVPEGGTMILNADDRFFELWKEMAGNRQVISFGFSVQADVRTDLSTCDSAGMRFNLEYQNGCYPVRLKLAGNHNISNALAAAAAATAAEVPMEKIAGALGTVSPVAGRLKTLRGINKSIIIDDSYNANPSSYLAALEVLTGFTGRRWLILGAFAELGDDSLRFHEELGHKAKTAGVERLFTFGPDAKTSVGAFGNGAHHFENRTELINEVKKHIDQDIVALIKGSRSQHMEIVVDALTDRASGE